MALEKLNINGISELDFPTGVSSVSVTDDIATINLTPAPSPTQVIADFTIDSGAPAPIVANDIVAWGANYNNDGVTQAEGDYPIVGVALTGGNAGDTITVQLAGTVLVNSLGITEASPVVCNVGNPGKGFSNAVGNPYVAEQIAGFGLASGVGLRLMQLAPYSLPPDSSFVVTKGYTVESTAPAPVLAGQVVTINTVTGNTIQTCTASDVPLGIVFNSAAQGDLAIVILFGAALALAVGTFTNGTLLAVDASGNVIPSAPSPGTSNRIIGMVQGASVTGTINVIVFPGVDVAASTVTSVFGRTGAVVAATNDYNFNQLAGKAGLAQGGTNVDLSASGGATQVLAQDAAHVVSARNLIAADIPSLSATYQVRSEKDAASGYAGLTSGVFLKDAEFNLTRNAQTGTSYAILDSDRAKLITVSNAAAIALTIAQAGTAGAFADGWYAQVKNIGASTAILTPTTSTIETAAQVIIPPGAVFTIYSDGTNFRLSDVSVDTSLNGWDFFGMDGLHRNLNGSGSGAIVSTANVILAIPCKLERATLVKNIKFSNTGNTSGSAQTTDMGLADTLGNVIIHTGAKSFANGALQSVTTQAVTSSIFLPGTYLGCWTASATTVTFIETPSYIVATSATWGNVATPKFFILCGGSPSSGALPASLGTLTGSALGSGGVNANVPVVQFVSA